MKNRKSPDSIDQRAVCWAYAAVAWFCGFVLLAQGTAWLRVDSGAIQAASTILLCGGCFAAALAPLDQARARRSAVTWFVVAHAIVWSAVLLQFRRPGVPNHLIDTASALVPGAAVVFVYLFFTAEGEFRPPELFISLFGTSRAASEQLRSAYEVQIRKAAAQEERNRLARDLHDSVKQQIFVIQTAAATAQARFDQDPDGAREAVQQVRDSAREAMTEMEAMLDQLRAAPLENAGLLEALKQQCEALQFRTGAQVRLEAGKLPASEVLAPGTQEAVFRVAQEALANIARHARAKKVTISLGAAAGHVELRVRDDGSGFAAGAISGGMGLTNMRARAEEIGGTLEVGSQPGQGTAITLAVPYKEETAAQYRNRAMMWSGLLLAHIALLFWARWISALPVIVIASVGAFREARAYYRTRAQNEALA